MKYSIEQIEEPIEYNPGDLVIFETEFHDTSHPTSKKVSIPCVVLELTSNLVVVENIEPGYVYMVSLESGAPLMTHEQNVRKAHEDERVVVRN